MTFKEKKEIITQYEDFPYCIVATSQIDPSFGVTMKAEGIKKIAELLNEGDLLHIKFHGGSKPAEFSISRKEKNE